MRAEVAIATLKVFAWLSLVIGALASLLTIVTLVSLPGGVDFSTFLFAFAPMVYSGLLWAFLMVVAIIAENVIYISETTYAIAEALNAGGWAGDEEEEAIDPVAYESVEAAPTSSRVRKVARTNTGNAP